MEPQLTQIREQQKATWNKFSPGWKKWDDFTMNFLKPMGDAIIESLQIKDDDIVLDVASGTGEPALTIAGIAKNGKVTATDVADQMLVIAKENAERRQLHNFDTKACDVCELPFDDSTFNKISCRMGFMFFPDMQMASNEMFRVLRPGGRIATAVWAGPEYNVWITSIMGVISRNIPTTPPPPGAPGMFRCGVPGSIRNLLENSGFKNVNEKLVTGKTVYDDFDHFWDMMNEVAAPVVGALSQADEETRQKVKSEVQQLVEKYRTGKGLEFDYGSWVVSGEK